MKKLLIDTGAFLAQRNPSDQHHADAQSAFRDLADSATLLFSTEHILDETLTLLARRESYAYAAQTGTELLSSRSLRWLDATAADWDAALVAMRKFADQSVSFTDCLSFVLMKREGIKDAFAFDRHFRAAGFRVWPPRP